MLDYRESSRLSRSGVLDYREYPRLSRCGMLDYRESARLSCFRVLDYRESPRLSRSGLDYRETCRAVYDSKFSSSSDNSRLFNCSKA